MGINLCHGPNPVYIAQISYVPFILSNKIPIFLGWKQAISPKPQGEAAQIHYIMPSIHSFLFSSLLSYFIDNHLYDFWSWINIVLWNCSDLFLVQSSYISNLSCDFSFLNKFPRGYALCNSNLQGKYKELIYTQGRTVGHIAPRILLFQLHQNCCHVLVEKHKAIYWRSRGTKASRSLSKKRTIKDTTVQKCLLPFLLFSAKEQNYILFPVFLFDTRITSRTVK